MTARRAAPGRRAPGRAQPDGPVLLVGEGVGLLSLAAHLRRNGVEAYLVPRAEEPLRPFLERVFSTVKPRILAVSLKWFQHTAWALSACAIARELSPDVVIVVGGNTATFWWREVLGAGTIDYVVMGDGERPLLAICRGDLSPPNCAFRRDGELVRTRRTYVQGGEDTLADLGLAGLHDTFLSKRDLHEDCLAFVVTGKGCTRHCLYCAGGREMQAELFGRHTPFLRPVEDVAADIEIFAPYHDSLLFDFDDPTAPGMAGYYDRLFRAVDVSRKSAMMWTWNLPSRAALERLAGAFGHITLGVDMGCPSERQRKELVRRGELKPCPTDRALLRFLDEADLHANVAVQVHSVDGLPFLEPSDLDAARDLLAQVLTHRSVTLDGWLAQPLEYQPGAAISEEPERYGLVSQARGFDEIRLWFERTKDMPKLLPADPPMAARVADWYEDARRMAIEATTARTIQPNRSMASLRGVVLQAAQLRRFGYAGRAWSGPLAPDPGGPVLWLTTAMFHGEILCSAGGPPYLAVLGAFEKARDCESAWHELRQKQGMSAVTFIEAVAALNKRGFLRTASR